MRNRCDDRCRQCVAGSIDVVCQHALRCRHGQRHLLAGGVGGRHADRRRIDHRQRNGRRRAGLRVGQVARRIAGIGHREAEAVRAEIARGRRVGERVGAAGVLHQHPVRRLRGDRVGELACRGFGVGAAQHDDLRCVVDTLTLWAIATGGWFTGVTVTVTVAWLSSPSGSVAWKVKLSAP